LLDITSFEDDGVSLTAGSGNVAALTALVFVTLVFAGAYKFGNKQQ
jgi:hypothetical protein